MTREEAIMMLIHTKEFLMGDKICWSKYDCHIEAIDMAIEALSADTSSDLISRANAIRWVKTECNPYGKPTLDYDSGLKVIEHLKKMPSELPSTEAEWIPCSERLPSNNGCVLVTVDDGIEFGKCEDGEWSIWVCEHWDEWDAKGVTAWMPLPKPYRKDGEADETD